MIARPSADPGPAFTLILKSSPWLKEVGAESLISSGGGGVGVTGTGPLAGTTMGAVGGEAGAAPELELVVT